MPNFALILAAFLASELAVAPCAASTVQSLTQSPSAPAKLADAREFEFPSVSAHRTYKIYVSVPSRAAPVGGYPVLYVLDGDAAFPTAEAQALLSANCGGTPILVVGIAYPDALAAMKLRTRDLTPSMPSEHENTWMHGEPKDFGGADDFHKFMSSELKPAISKLYPVNHRQEVLMGYSLGGLFALRVLFNHPEAYATYVVGSPSIWWDDKQVLMDEAAFTQTVSAGQVAPRILITSDEHEQEPKDDYARMVDNASELARRLQSIHGRAGYSVRYALLPGETHNSGIPASTSQGISFVQSGLGKPFIVHQAQIRRCE